MNHPIHLSHRPASIRLGWMLSLLACSPIGAQTFIVDSANGPGTNFTDIPTAVMAVPSGATLHVRPGNYNSFSISNKSLTVIGHPSTGGAFPTVNVNALFPGIFIGSLTASQSVRISGFDVGGTASSVQFSISGCSGQVLIEDMAWTFQVPLSMNVINSANVHAMRLSLSSFLPNGTTPANPPVVVQNSSVEFWRLITQGYRATASGVSATPGMRITQQSRVVLVEPNIAGGFALVSGSIPGPGVLVNASTLHVSGNTAVGASAITGGGIVSGAGGTGLVLQQGSFARVRGSNLSGGFGFPTGPAFTRDASSTIDHDPTDVPPSAFLTGTVQPGSTIRFTMQAQPGSLSALLFGFDAQFAMPGLLTLGAFGVNTIATVAPGLVPASGRVEVPVQVLANWPTDSIFLAQYLVLDPATNEIAASNLFAGTSR